MPISVFEAACVLIIALTLGWEGLRARATSGSARSLLATYATLAVAGYLGEETCIKAYSFYAYSPRWHARLDEVPLLVPLIWPLVILSARAVAERLWPGLSTGRRALVVAVIVVFDASLVEVTAVRADLWTWAEGGHLGVPVIGIVGWGYFAFASEWLLSLSPRVRYAAAIVGAPLLTHAMILASWWGGFRWLLRGALGDASFIGVAIGSFAMVLVALRLRAKKRTMPLEVAVPRMAAASLFVALLATTAPGDLRLWAHAAAVAIPYFAITPISR